MKRTGAVLASMILGAAALGSDAAGAPPPRVVDLRASDGALLKATFFAAAGKGPGVLLLHQINRSRKSWDEVAAGLAAAGIHALTLDLRDSAKAPALPSPRSRPGRGHSCARRDPATSTRRGSSCCRSRA